MNERLTKATARVAVAGLMANRADRRAHLSAEAVPALKEVGHSVLCDPRMTWGHKWRLLAIIRAAILDRYAAAGEAV